MAGAEMLSAASSQAKAKMRLMENEKMSQSLEIQKRMLVNGSEKSRLLRHRKHNLLIFD